jgi:hypothetical protein
MAKYLKDHALTRPLLSCDCARERETEKETEREREERL